MAKSKRGSHSNQAKANSNIPEGFDINIERERGEGWISKEADNEVIGRLLGRQEYKDKRGKTRAFYQIQLTGKTNCQVSNPDYNEEAEDSEEFVTKLLGEGAIVNIDEFKKLEDLRPYTKNGGVYDVWFKIIEKVELDNGQEMWNLAGPRLKCVKKPNPDAGTGDGWRS